MGSAGSLSVAENEGARWLRPADGEPAAHYAAVIVGQGSRSTTPHGLSLSGRGVSGVGAGIESERTPACLQADLSGNTLSASGFWTGGDAGATSPSGRSEPVPKRPLEMA